MSEKKTFADHEKSKYWSEKNILKPHEVSFGSGKSYLFLCDCGHEFLQKLNSIQRGRWCSYCSSQKLCDNDECHMCFEKSFESVIHNLPPDKKWSNKNDILPRQIFKTSGKKYIFECTECTHDYEINLYDVKRGRGCPFCASKILCQDENCNICFEKSFASHYRAIYFSDENNINPRNIFKADNREYIFNCHICNHTFKNKLYNITSKSSIWCPFCSIPSKEICNNNDCDWCFRRSFASHPQSQYWSSKNEKTPREIIKCSNNLYIFDCNYCHNEITQTPNNIVSNNRWCNICCNKTERKLYDFLKIHFSDIQKEYKFDWCKNINYLPFDFCIIDKKIIIELDGRQHFIQVSNWQSPEKQLENDIYKIQCANKNGYYVIRILQEDVLFDEYDWQNELLMNIQTMTSVKKNMYMCKNNEYQLYKDI